MLPDMTTFIALALQMGHILKETLHDYWSRLRQLHIPFYGKTMTGDRFLHILRFLHFADNSQRPDQGEEYDRLWKLRTVFDTLDDNYALTTISSLFKNSKVKILEVECGGRKTFFHLMYGKIYI